MTVKLAETVSTPVVRVRVRVPRGALTATVRLRARLVALAAEKLFTVMPVPESVARDAPEKWVFKPVTLSVNVLPCGPFTKERLWTLAGPET